MAGGPVRGRGEHDAGVQRGRLAVSPAGFLGPGRWIGDGDLESELTRLVLNAPGAWLAFGDREIKVRRQ
jgi:hypothetical protein